MNISTITVNCLQHDIQTIYFLIVFFYNRLCIVKLYVCSKTASNIECCQTARVSRLTWLYTDNIWAAPWQNLHSAFTTQTCTSAESVRCFSTCNRVCRRTAWILIRLCECAGWSGSMLFAKALCKFCHDMACFNHV
jgi:hypothetical protein